MLSGLGDLGQPLSRRPRGMGSAFLVKGIIEKQRERKILGVSRRFQATQFTLRVRFVQGSNT